MVEHLPRRRFHLAGRDEQTRPGGAERAEAGFDAGIGPVSSQPVLSHYSFDFPTASTACSGGK